MKDGNTVFYGVLVLVFGLIAFGFSPERPFDSTDNPPHRSGLAVRTDCATGLQYLETQRGGLTPRLDSNGTQIRLGC